MHMNTTKTMKTIPLTELLAKATHKTIHVHPADYYVGMGVGVREAFILANHASRHIGPLVEALEQWETFHSGHVNIPEIATMLVQTRKALAAAKNVEVGP